MIVGPWISAAAGRFIVASAAVSSAAAGRLHGAIDARPWGDAHLHQTCERTTRNMNVYIHTMTWITSNIHT